MKFFKKEKGIEVQPKEVEEALKDKEMDKMVEEYDLEKGTTGETTGTGRMGTQQVIDKANKDLEDTKQKMEKMLKDIKETQRKNHEQMKEVYQMSKDLEMQEKIIKINLQALKSITPKIQQPSPQEPKPEEKSADTFNI